MQYTSFRGEKKRREDAAKKEQEEIEAQPSEEEIAKEFVKWRKTWK